MLELEAKEAGNQTKQTEPRIEKHEAESGKHEFEARHRKLDLRKYGLRKQEA
jgi:hypothetical protein